MFGKINQRGITWKLRKGAQSFSYTTCCPNLIHIPIKLHEDIPNLYRVTRKQESREKIKQKGITWKVRKGEQSFLCVTCCSVPIHIPIKLHEDILRLKGY